MALTAVPTTLTIITRHSGGLSKTMSIELPKPFSDGKRLYLTEMDTEQLTNWVWEIVQKSPLTVRFLRGRKLQSESGMFDEFSAALQFPLYFGENWDAFDECMSDLEWLNGSILIVVITEAQELLSGSIPFGDLLELLSNSAAELEQNGRTFITVLQCDSSSLTELSETLDSHLFNFGEIR